MKKINPLKTPLNALFGSEEVIGSNPEFHTLRKPDLQIAEKPNYFGDSDK